MKKIQIKAFDRRRNQNFWFHFCYIPEDLGLAYNNKFKTYNMDALIKAWVKQDFGFEIIYMEDIYEAKELIKQKYSEMYPEVFIANEGDRQGWSRVWLVEKVRTLLEVN